MNQLQRLFWLTGMFSVVLVPAAQADSLETPSFSAPEVVPVEELNRSQEPEPATTVEEWIGQIEAQEQSDAATELAQALTAITGVQVSKTDSGLELTLEATGPLAEPRTSVVGNAVIAEISNAALDLPEGEAFEQFDPADGIALVSVTELPDNRVRVSITGNDGPPTADITVSASGLVLAITAGTEAVATGEDAIQVVVTGEQEEGYVVDNATTATRTNTPIRDIPQSIQVIPRQVIEDQGSTTLEDALRSVAGVQPDNNGGNIAATQTFIIRGFEQANLFRNGFPTSATTPIDVAGVERVEILRGPASVLFGQLEPGGIINVISKRPLSEPFYSFEGQIGNFDFYRPTLDISGPLTEDGDLLYRLNVAYTNTDSFRDFVERETIYVAPVISYEFSDRTRITVDLEYTDDDRTLDRGLPIIGDEPGEFPIPRSRFLQEPGDALESEDIFTGYEFEHDFSDNWQFRNMFRYHSRQSRAEEISAGFVADDNRTLNRGFSLQKSRVNEFNLIADVRGEFLTGSIEHDLLFGIDLRRQTEDFEGQFKFAFNANLPIDIFDPVFGASIPDDLLDSTIDQKTDRLGIYLQDQISLLDNLILLLGGRLDFTRSALSSRGAFGDFDNEVSDTAFSPRVGLVYRPIEPVSLYASYSESFNPLTGFSAGVTFEGEPFEPTTGQQFEIGAKTELLDSRLAATLALYNLTQQNVVTADPNNPGFQIQTGEVRSRGIELDVIGEILPGLNIIFSYAFTDAEITEDNSGREGLRPTNVAEHAGNLWLTYEFQQGTLEGLGLGAGVFSSSRIDGPDGTFFLPGYTRVDLATWYEFAAGESDVRLQLNVNNLFDTEFFRATSGRAFSDVGDPLTVIGSVSVTF